MEENKSEALQIDNNNNITKKCIISMEKTIKMWPQFVFIKLWNCCFDLGETEKVTLTLLLGPVRLPSRPWSSSSCSSRSSCSSAGSKLYMGMSWCLSFSSLRGSEIKGAQQTSHGLGLGKQRLSGLTVSFSGYTASGRREDTEINTDQLVWRQSGSCYSLDYLW